MTGNQIDPCLPVESNLYGFYFCVAAHNALEYRQELFPRYVKNKSGSWPAYVLGSAEQGDGPDPVAKVASGMGSGHLPPFWILKEPDQAEPFLESLARHNLRPAARWTGMSLVQQDFKDRAEVPVGLQTGRVENERDLEIWTALVNNEVFRKNTAAPSIFNHLLEDPAFGMYASWMEGHLVGTALSFTHDGVSGLYLIGTDVRFRRRGIGGAVTAFAARDCFSRGIEQIVLHATKEGAPLYKKLGFRKFCYFDVLWMLGKSG